MEIFIRSVKNVIRSFKKAFCLLVLVLLLLPLFILGDSLNTKLYYPDGPIQYQGDWKDNYAEGLGKQYDIQGRLLYSGSWKMGLYDGEGTLYHAETGIPLYEGQWSEGLPTEEGIFYQKNGEELSFSLGYLYFEYVLQNPTEDPEEEIKKLLYLENIVELSSMDVQFKKLLYQLIEVPEEKHNKDVVLSSIEQLAHLPQDMLAYLVDQKTKIRFINGFITEEPEVQDIYDEEKNIHIRDVDGVYVIESNLILLRILEKDTPLTMLHEIGHAYEWLTKKLYSQSPEFIEIWALEAERVFKRKNKESSYWYKHPDEYFAEFFASYFTIDAYRFSWDSHHSKEELKKIAPLTYDLFDKEIAVFNYDAKKQIGQPIKKAVNR